ncbi:MAG: cyclic peptide export ABC transporter [Magnetococcus sp. DMHC-1]
MIEEGEQPKNKLVFLSVTAGLSNSLLLAIVNHASQITASGESVKIHYLIIYAILLGTFSYAQYYVLATTAVIVENILCKVRVRVANKIRQAELTFVENTSFQSIFNCLSQETTLISQGSSLIFKSLVSAALLVTTLIYIAWLSMTAFVIAAAAIALGFLFYLQRRQKIVADLDESTERQRKYFEAFEQTFTGFKEIKINQAKNYDLYCHQVDLAKNVEQLRSRAGISMAFIMNFSDIFFYSLLASIIFIWPMMASVSSVLIAKLTVCFIYLVVGPLDFIVSNLPIFIKVEMAVNNLKKLEIMLDESIKNVSVEVCKPNPQPKFKMVCLENVQFEYFDSENNYIFSIGPINLEIKRNETLFIVGGNGSGKSTLLKILLGLYYPSEGHIVLDGVRLNRDDYPEYRELYSAIFSDFHIFDKFYGVKHVDDERLRELLKIMKLEKNTDFINGKYTNINLSTGQRKRLAYIAALMDDKEIYIFDEWAADQDPNFRKYFYEILLPDLHKNGKTIISVTHDDKYFHIADRVIKLDAGKIVRE